MRSLILVFACLFYLGFHLELSGSKNETRYALPEHTPTQFEPMFEQYWVSNEETREAHSANITVTGGTPIAIWYGGSEEGHADVALFMSRFDGVWSTPVAFVDRLTAKKSLGRHIRKIGNPAIHIWPDGALGVFYVSVSMGGWGASAINYVESSDLGSTWSEPKRLVTSPFLNISTLVRTRPLQMQDGSIELPVYHEFIGKFSESLRITRDISVIDKRRISWGTDSLQPAIAPIDATHSIALLRYAGEPPGRILRSESMNAGMTWTSPERLSLPNPNSAISLLNIGSGRLLLALNDTEDGRNRLSLAMRTTNEDDWHVIKTIEVQQNSGDEEFEFSYPSLAIDGTGHIHLVYTWNQRRIRHVRFNRAWLENESS